jgi:hypothetical protein
VSYFRHWMKITSALTLPSKTIIQNWLINKNLPQQTETKIIHDLQIFHYRRFYKEFCTQKMKANKSTSRQGISNNRRRKDKQSESSIHSAAHNQILKQWNQLNGRNHHLLTIVTINVNGLTPPSKETIWQTGLKRKTWQCVAYKRPILLTDINTGLEWKAGRRFTYFNFEW